MRRAPRSRDPTRLLKCAQLWSCSSIVSASELCVDHVEGVEHDSTIRLMVEARLGTLNGRVEVKRSISRLFLNVLEREIRIQSAGFHRVFISVQQK